MQSLSLSQEIEAGSRQQNAAPTSSLPVAHGGSLSCELHAAAAVPAAAGRARPHGRQRQPDLEGPKERLQLREVRAGYCGCPGARLRPAGIHLQGERSGQQRPRRGGRLKIRPGFFRPDRHAWDAPAHLSSTSGGSSRRQTSRQAPALLFFSSRTSSETWGWMAVPSSPTVPSSPSARAAAEHSVRPVLPTGCWARAEAARRCCAAQRSRASSAGGLGSRSVRRGRAGALLPPPPLGRSHSSEKGTPSARSWATICSQAAASRHQCTTPSRAGTPPGSGPCCCLGCCWPSTGQLAAPAASPAASSSSSLLLRFRLEAVRLAASAAAGPAGVAARREGGTGSTRSTCAAAQDG